MSASSKRAPGLWDGQLLHLGCLVLLLILVWITWDYLGRPFAAIFWSAVAFPVVHQLFVWLAWRLELRSSATSKAIGFLGYVALFFLLFGGRFVSLAALGWMDRGSLGLEPAPLLSVTLLLALPGVYAMVSVKRYFGMKRAAGADHFDSAYRDLPLVKKGIFRYTNNGMYVYAFLLFWALAIGLNSTAALVVAAFSHVYIWVHFHATEQPDMRFLYGSK